MICNLKTALFFLCTRMVLQAIVAKSCEDHDFCHSPQSGTIGKQGIIRCQVKPGYLEVHWFEEPNYENFVIMLQGNKRLGYKRDEYDILQDGSLIMNNVSERNNMIYKVVVVYDHFCDLGEFVTFDVIGSSGQSTEPTMQPITDVPILSMITTDQIALLNSTLYQTSAMATSKIQLPRLSFAECVDMTDCKINTTFHGSLTCSAINFNSDIKLAITSSSTDLKLQTKWNTKRTGEIIISADYSLNKSRCGSNFTVTCQVIGVSDSAEEAKDATMTLLADNCNNEKDDFTSEKGRERFQVGIIIAVIVCALILVLLGVFILLRKLQKKKKKAPENHNNEAVIPML